MTERHDYSIQHNGEHDHIIKAENDHVCVFLLLDKTKASIDEVIEISEPSHASDEDDNDVDREDRAYNEYAKTDPVRRFQFDYDEHVA